MADTRDFPQLIQRQSVHLTAQVEAEVRHAFLFFARLRIPDVLLFDGREDGFRIHGSTA
jgi:hypothetical protein